MPPTVDFPTIVKQALELFGEVFDNEPARRHFAEYLTGLMVAERKNVSAINRQFAVTTDQSCLNRWLVEAPWERRRSTTAVWRGYRATRKPATTPTASLPLTIPCRPQRQAFRGRGLVVGLCPAAPRQLISNYVCPSGSHYPIEWRRFRKKDSCPAQDFKDHTTLCLDLIDDALARDIPGDFTFDSISPTPRY